MKISLIVVSVLLVITIAGGGFFISNLTGQINELENEVANSLEEISSDISAESANFETELGMIKNAVEDTNSAITDLSVTSENQLALVTDSIQTNTSKISGLDSRITVNEDALNETVITYDELYDTVRQSIVRITDGEQLQGSGFVMADSGSSSDSVIKIVTAYHVISDMTEIYVTLHDGRTWKTQIFAMCEESDIAILSLRAPVSGQLPSASSIPSLSIGDSSSVKPGDPVFIIGSPGAEAESSSGLWETMNAGIISQINRRVTIDDNQYANLLQVDAAANFGNSGGPLFNGSGEVIGVMVARINPLQGDGISFAVASSMVKKVNDAITGSNILPHVYEYPVLGILTMVDVTPKDIFDNDNEITGGAKVVLAGYPASIAGVQTDDIINKIDTRDVRDCAELSSFIAEYYSPGDTVTLNIYRNGEKVSVDVKLAENT